MLADNTVKSLKVDDIFIRLRTESKEVLEKFEVSCVAPLSYCIIDIKVW